MLYLVFTDIEGSTRLWEKHGPAMAAALVRHDAIIGDAVTRYGGRVIKHTGDGVFAVFERGAPAACALELQRSFAREDWGLVSDVRVRIAIHAGEAEHREGDYFGTAVNRAARLCEAAWGGQILMTAEAAAAIEIPAGITLEDLGAHVLKDLGEPERVYQLLDPALPPKGFPPLRSLSSHPHNLPPQPTPFIGREEELTAVKAMLRDPAKRLVTLLGPGGVGKTRLSLQAAAECIEDFDWGVYFVPLAPLNTPESLIPAVADALRFTFYGRADQKVELLHYLREKCVLLLMDNFEHLVNAAALLAEITEEAPKVKILVSSRERLHLKGENVYEVRGMDYPADDRADSFETFSAVRLFVESARRVDPTFSLTPQGYTAVREICRMVGGLPLGIELAASWIKVLTPQEIAAEITGNVGFLETSLRDVPERHRSLRAVFDYSWSLLTQPQQAVFMRMSAFSAGFRREAAQIIAQADLTLLQSLVDKSLLRRSYAGRYEVPDAIAPFAYSQLAANARELETTLDRHRDYYAAFFLERENDLLGLRQKEIIEEIGAEVGNARSAWNRALGARNLGVISALAQGLFQFFDIRGRFREGEEMFRAAANVIGGLQGKPASVTQEEAAVVARVLSNAGWFAARLYQYEEAEALLDRGLAYARRAGSFREEGSALDCLGMIALRRGRFEDASYLFYKSRDACERAGDDFGRALAQEHLGNVAFRQGNYEQACRFYADSLAVFENLGFLRGVSSCYSNQGDVAVARGAISEAREYARKSLTIQQDLGFPLGVASSLITLGEVGVATGDYAEADRLFGESLAIQKEIGNRWGEALAKEKLAVVAWERGDYDRARELLCDSLNTREKIGDREGVASSVYQLGEVAYIVGDYDEAKRYFEKALAIQIEIGVRNAVATSLSALGNTAWKSGNYAEAKRLQQDALDIRRDIGDRRGIAATLNTMGHVLCSEGDYETARRSYEDSLSMCREIGYLRGISAAVNNLGDVAMETGDAAGAVRLYRESLALDRELGHPRGICISLNNLATAAFSANEFEEAQTFSREGLQLSEKIGYREGVIYFLTNLGVIAAARGDGDGARGELERAHANALEIRSVPLALEIAAAAAELYGQSEERERAVAILTFVADHAAVEKYHRDRALAARERVEKGLNPEAIRRARDRAGALTLETLLSR